MSVVKSFSVGAGDMFYINHNTDGLLLQMKIFKMH